MKNFILLQIIPSLDSGGAERGTVDLANYLAEKNIHSYIISNGGKMLPYLNRKRVRHIQLPVNSKNLLIMPFVARKVSKIIKENKINIVHVRSRAPAWMMKFIPIKNFKTVSTFHNIYGTQYFLKQKYNQAMSKFDHVVAISNYVKMKITELYGINANKISVIQRGVDENFFNPKINNYDEFEIFLSKYKIPSNKKIILYPGRLTDWKGQIEFLNIIESFKNKKIICYFVGDDKNQSYTKKLLKEIKDKGIEKNCKILGHLSSKDLKMMYICSDLVISTPKKPEGFGRTIAESLLMKKIILAYNYGGAQEQLEELNSIYKISPHDQDELKIKITKSLNLSNSYKEKLGIVSRKHIIKNFSKQKMLDGYLKFYQKKVL